MQDNVAQLDVDPRLANVYAKIWEAIEEANEASPLTWAAIAGILGMITSECHMIMMGYEDDEH